jgi:hypothetical protein
MSESNADCELLELAAKAAGFNYDPQHSTDTELFRVWLDADMDVTFYWNPLADDGDALRLAVELKMCVGVVPSNIKDGHATVALAPANPVEIGETHADDPYAATRRAIVRAAAEIGRTMI